MWRYGRVLPLVPRNRRPSPVGGDVAPVWRPGIAPSPQRGGQSASVAVARIATLAGAHSSGHTTPAAPESTRLSRDLEGEVAAHAPGQAARFSSTNS